MIKMNNVNDYDKRNGNIVFNEKNHKYWDLTNPNANFISVTTLIDRFVPPYDKEFWSMYKALEQLVPKEDWKTVSKPLRDSYKIPEEIYTMYEFTKQDAIAKQQEILDEWQQKNEESCERGTKIHAMLENSFYKMGANCNLQKFGIGGKFICDKGRTTLDLEDGVYPEYLISRISNDGILRLAGQIDLLVKKGHHYTIIDHKTNSKIETKGFYNSTTRGTSKMKYPLNNLDDCNYNHYNLQLSTYAWMIQKKDPEAVIDDLILNWYPHEGGNKQFHMEYIKKDVIKMLKWYKKQLLHEITESKYTEINY